MVVREYAHVNGHEFEFASTSKFANRISYSLQIVRIPSVTYYEINKTSRDAHQQS